MSGSPSTTRWPPPASDIPGRPGLTDVEQRAFDRYVPRVRLQHRMTSQLESQLRAASPDELRRRLRHAIAEQPQVDAIAEQPQIQDTNAPDPRQGRFEVGPTPPRWFAS